MALRTLASIVLTGTVASFLSACIPAEDPDLPSGLLDGSLGGTQLDGGPLINAQHPDGARPPSATPVSALDILFVIDNSGSMASEQMKLARELTRMVNVLTSGDRYAEREDQVPVGLPEKSRRFTPVSSLHVGVVSTNMGGMLPSPPRAGGAAIASCVGLGDDAKLRHSTQIAIDGVFASRGEFGGAYDEGETVLPPAPECQLGELPPYQQYLTNEDPMAVGLAFRCVARLGVRGCPFEQPLEAMWKALAPDRRKGGPDLYTFAEGTSGQGELANAGFLREDAVLAVVHLTDEEDCSITDEGKLLFDPSAQAQADYGPINLRCGKYADDSALVRATARYVSGLRSLKPDHPNRLVFAAVVGVPAQAIQSGATYDEILALPEMQFREDPQRAGLTSPSCALMTDGKNNEAYPARRFVEVAKSLGEQAVLESICADSYGPAIDRVVNKIAPLLAAH